MSKKKIETVTKNVEATFHLVVIADKGTDIEHMLKNETDWLGEPTSPAGNVVTMHLKKICEIKNGK